MLELGKSDIGSVGYEPIDADIAETTHRRGIVYGPRMDLEATIVCRFYQSPIDHSEPPHLQWKL